MSQETVDGHFLALGKLACVEAVNEQHKFHLPTRQVSIPQEPFDRVIRRGTSEYWKGTQIAA